MADDRTYIRVHDGLDEHPKVEPLSDGAFRLLFTCWFYCSRNRTDGHIKDAVWRKRGTAKARKELIDAGLVEQRDGYVEMHDYLEHQRSAQEIKLLQQVRGDVGDYGNHVRWHVVRRKPKKDCEHCQTGPDPVATPSQKGSQTDRKPVASTEAEAEAEAESSSTYVERGGYVPNASDTPPLYSDRCKRHAHVANPEPCGGCADARKAARQRPALTLVAPDKPTCREHPGQIAEFCGPCRSERIGKDTA